MVVVGNHSDCPPEERQVTKSEGKLFAEKSQCAFVEASSRYNENVQLAFQLMIAQIEESKDGWAEPNATRSCVSM